jgi:phosphate transport system permease protein
MTTSLTPPRTQEPYVAEPTRSLRAGTLPAWGPWAVLAGSALVAVLVAIVALGGGLIAWVVVTVLVYLIAIYVVSSRVEGRRRGLDRLVTAVVSVAFGLALIPLVSVIWTVLENGGPALSGAFFSEDLRGVVGEGGGIAHAILGTVIITLMAAVISVPVGLLTSIYLVEYGTGKLARAITFFVDVMTGIPSIVAGLFAYALFVVFLGPGVRMGLAGAVALSVLMIPVVIRSSEEMLRLVPNELREASFALGIPKWRTIVKMVLPTAAAGIGTGVTLSIARVVGETAPLLIVAGFTNAINTDPFDGRMMTLPVFVYNAYTQPGIPPEVSIERAWGAALVLILFVMALNLVARVFSRVFAPKAGR